MARNKKTVEVEFSATSNKESFDKVKKQVQETGQAAQGLPASSEERYTQVKQLQEQAASWANARAEVEKMSEILRTKLTPDQKYVATIGQQIFNYADRQKVSLQESAQHVREMNVELKLTDQNISSSVEEAAKLNEQFAKAEKESGQAAEGFERDAQAYMAARRAMQAGMMLQQLGAQIEAPFQQGQQAYLKSASIGAKLGYDETAVRYQQAIAKSEQSWSRIGKIVTTQQVPGLERSAALMQMMADLAEAQPGMVSAVTGVGGVAKGLGGAISTGADLAMTGYMLKQMGIVPAGAGAAIGGVAGKVGGGFMAGSGAVGGLGAVGAGLGFAGAGLAGAGLGYAGYGALAGSGLGQQAGMNKMAGGQALALGGLAAGQIFGGPDLAEKWFITIAKATGAIDESTAAEMRLGNARKAGKTAADMLKETEAEKYASGEAAYKSFRDQMTSIDENYSKQELAIREQTNKQKATIDKQASDQEIKLKKDLAKQFQQQDEANVWTKSRDVKREAFADAETQREINKQRGKIQEGYAASRIEADKAAQEQEAAMLKAHQRSLADINANYQDTMEDAIANNDAIAAINATKAHGRAIDSENENYSDSLASLREGLGKQLEAVEASKKDQLDAIDEQIKESKERRGRQKTFEAGMEKEEIKHQRDLAEAALKEAVDQIKTDATTRKNELDAQSAEALGKLDTDVKEAKTKLVTQFKDALGEMGLLSGDLKDQFNAKKKEILGAWDKFYNELIDNTANFDVQGQAAPNRDLQSQKDIARYGAPGLQRRMQETGRMGEDVGGSLINATINMNQQFSFTGVLSEAEQLKYKQVAYDQGMLAFNDSLKAANKGR